MCYLYPSWLALFWTKISIQIIDMEKNWRKIEVKSFTNTPLKWPLCTIPLSVLDMHVLPPSYHELRIICPPSQPHISYKYLFVIYRTISEKLGTMDTPLCLLCIGISGVIMSDYVQTKRSATQQTSIDINRSFVILTQYPPPHIWCKQRPINFFSISCLVFNKLSISKTTWLGGICYLWSLL